ncbi:hypothetical protein COR50_20805 [Chitinophaga caeni]|uniref:Uncharacterized protein n=1 Tax=Chitinophaga caeni TaxID=2029983 RepID=A0A291QZG6_9BACT|nr:hypothetical protein [Chitinophaga caeni]ATL49419.1 hypothetical protein COR50_20805 [Chitinophaga caeni]
MLTTDTTNPVPEQINYLLRDFFYKLDQIGCTHVSVSLHMPDENFRAMTILQSPETIRVNETNNLEFISWKMDQKPMKNIITIIKAKDAATGK